MESRTIGPAEAHSRLIQHAEMCDKGVLISFHKEIENGVDGFIPRIHVFNMNVGDILAAHNHMHMVLRTRLEYVLLDYVRVLTEQGVFDEKEAGADVPVPAADPAVGGGDDDAGDLSMDEGDDR